MDPASLPHDLPPETLFCDPGAHAQPQPRTWRPDGLPMPPDVARAFLRESRRFAQEHGKGKASLATASLVREDFYAQTALAIRAKLTAANESRGGDDFSLRAQQVLLLAWQLEQENLELRSMHRHVQADMAALAQTLGDDDADMDENRTFAHEPLLQEPTSSPPWQRIVQALMFFTPPRIVLTTFNIEVAAAMEEAGLKSAGPRLDQVSTELAALVRDGKARLLELPGWRIAGQSRQPEEKPWLASNRTLLLLPGLNREPFGEAA